jgi:hypothetical protein
MVDRLRNYGRPARPARAARCCRLQVEALEDRLVPSSTWSSAISIPHPYGTERDWYSVDQNTFQVVEFQGTTRRNLYGPTNVFEVSASIDPLTGHGEVFALSGLGTLWRCDSNGNWFSYPGQYNDISATRNGHVYASMDTPFYPTDVVYWGSTTKVDVGAPADANGPWAPFVAASVSPSGHNEVFVVGPNAAIYVNSANAPGHWRLVDNSAVFWDISASANDTVFGLTEGGHIIEETEHQFSFGGHTYDFWVSGDISNGLYRSISADLDASGHAEVYAITRGMNQAYLYDQGNWTYRDSDVFDISGAGGGYFYDVNYAGWNLNAWQYNPQSLWFPWTFLGSHLS